MVHGMRLAWRKRKVLLIASRERVQQWCGQHGQPQFSMRKRWELKLYALSDELNKYFITDVSAFADVVMPNNVSMTELVKKLNNELLLD